MVQIREPKTCPTSRRPHKSLDVVHHTIVCVGQESWFGAPLLHRATVVDRWSYEWDCMLGKNPLLSSSEAEYWNQIANQSLLKVAIPCVILNSYLVDPASSHMLVSKIKPCMSKYKLLILWNCEWLIKSVIVYLMVLTTRITVVILELIRAHLPTFGRDVFIR